MSEDDKDIEKDIDLELLGGLEKAPNSITVKGEEIKLDGARKVALGLLYEQIGEDQIISTIEENVNSMEEQVNAIIFQIWDNRTQIKQQVEEDQGL